MAMVGDASHMFADASSFFLSYLAAVLSVRGPSERYSFGHQRVEVVGAAASLLILWLITAYLVIEAIERFISPPDYIDGKLMFFMSLAAIAFNGLLFLVLGVHSHGPGSHTCTGKGHEGCAGHSHGHAHGSESEHRTGTGTGCCDDHGRSHTSEHRDGELCGGGDGHGHSHSCTDTHESHK